ncbi:MAG: M23 family metallopeptidase, partial [Candidatus Magasanikiibacteriota bacterium]
SIMFTIDSTPPSIPTISYEVAKESNTLKIKIHCREEGSGELFLHGVLVHTASCKKNSYVQYSEKNKLLLPYYATFTARVSDKAGNISSLSERSIYINDVNSHPKQKTCSAVFDMNAKVFSYIACSWGDELLHYEKTSSQGKDIFESNFTVAINAIAKVQLTVFNCKPKSIWDPRTWVYCVKEKVLEQNIDGKLTPLLTSPQEIRSMSNLSISIIHKKIGSLVISSRYLLQFSANVGEEIYSTEIISPTRDDNFTPNYANTKIEPYFSWIFKSLKEVSQWHGNTAYQRPHGGIDFSVSKETILSPAEGRVISVGYNKQSTCYSGGYYVGIQHSNGLFSYYFHLDSAKRPDKKIIQKGDRLKKQQPLAITGNSGQYNCEPLAAHLHFELRKNALPASHVNPVPYINVDWNSIRTSRANIFPGRLSGDNPHPKF